MTPTLPGFGRAAAAALAISALIACAGPEDGKRRDEAQEIVAPVMGPYSPAQVFIVRHGEKMADGPDLNARGRARAAAIGSWFTTNVAVLTSGAPVAIYAAAPPKAGGSMRSIETCTPYAEEQHLTVDGTFQKDDGVGATAKLLADPKIAGNSALFCWEHNAIPQLARALGAPDVPNSWPDDVYDRVWVLSYENGRVTSFKNLPEQLLPGDAVQ